MYAISDPYVFERVIAIQERAAFSGVALALPALFKYCAPESQHRLLDRAGDEIPYYFKSYDAARAKYDKLKTEGKKVVIRRPVGGHKLYRVKVL